MFSVMSPQCIFSDFNPSRPAPLSSSSPIRASQLSSPPPALAARNTPLSPRDRNALLPRRQVQSSPIQGPPPKFNLAAASSFAARGPARPNPILRSREGSQLNRRNIFFKGVQQRSDDRRWERRGVEQKLQSAEWFNLNDTLRRAREADSAGLLTDSDIADAERLFDQEERKPDELSWDPDSMDGMIDAMELEQEAEIEALFSSNPDNSAAQQPESPHWSDDDDYDAIFADLITEQGSQAPISSGDVEMS